MAIMAAGNSARNAVMIEVFYGFGWVAIRLANCLLKAAPDMKFRSLFSLVQIAAALGIAGDTFAAVTNQWTNTASSVWPATTNWSLAAAPSTSFDFIVISNAGTKTVTVDPSTPPVNLSVRSLAVSAPAGATNTLQLLNLPSGTPFTASRTVSIDRGGVLDVVNSTFAPQSTFMITAGTLQLDSGLVDTTANLIDVRVGRTSGTTGTVLLNGGTLKCFGFRLGELSGSQGSCTVNGGTLYSTSVLDMGEIVNSPGTLNILSGQVIVTNDVTRVGNLAAGTFNQSGGTASLSFWSIADNASGTANISGGQLTVTPVGALDVTRVGNFGTGQLNVSGGTVWLRGEFHVADNAGILGHVKITGGQLISTNDLVAIGRYGIGDLTISNANAWFTNTSVGRHDGAAGTLTVNNGANLFCVDDLSIGRFTNSVGHVFVTGGLLSLTNDNIWAGRQGAGDFTVSGGTVRAKALYVAASEGGTNAADGGSATFSGGTTILSSNLFVGTGLMSTGQVNVTGGVLAVTNASGSNAIHVDSGNFALAQGLVIADSVVLTNTSGAFSFTAGEMRAHNMIIANGSPFVVGDGTQSATLRLTGGTYSFADGLVISSNATVTGCGTIVGSVSNSGVLSTNCGGGGVVISSVSVSGSTATVSFSTLNGASHTLEFKKALNDPAWTAILPSVTGNGGVMSTQDTTATNAARFYRIHVQ